MYSGKLPSRISLFLILIISILLLSSCSSKNIANNNRPHTELTKDLNNNKIIGSSSTAKSSIHFKDNDNQYVSPSKSITPIPEIVEKNEAPQSLVHDDDFIDYIVNKGDTLFSICRKYQVFCPVGTAVKTVIALNKLTQANKLKEGMAIELPDKYFISGIKYTVKRGDTLFSIAQKHTTTTDMDKAIKTIMKDNFMTSYEVKIGDELFIENGI